MYHLDTWTLKGYGMESEPARQNKQRPGFALQGFPNALSAWHIAYIVLKDGYGIPFPSPGIYRCNLYVYIYIYLDPQCTSIKGLVVSIVGYMGYLKG